MMIERSIYSSKFTLLAFSESTPPTLPECIEYFWGPLLKSIVDIVDQPVHFPVRLPSMTTNTMSCPPFQQAFPSPFEDKLDMLNDYKNDLANRRQTNQFMDWFQ